MADVQAPYPFSYLVTLGEKRAQLRNFPLIDIRNQIRAPLNRLTYTI
jgi:hypothetical protein